MIKNLASWDRMARLVIGAALIVAYVAGLGGGWMGIGLIVGLVFVGTAFMSHCPLYRLLGLSTCPLDQSKR